VGLARFAREALAVLVLVVVFAARELVAFLHFLFDQLFIGALRFAVALESLELRLSGGADPSPGRGERRSVELDLPKLVRGSFGEFVPRHRVRETSSALSRAPAIPFEHDA